MEGESDLYWEEEGLVNCVQNLALGFIELSEPQLNELKLYEPQFYEPQL